MFDLTKEIKLSPALQKKYAISRSILHVVFVASAGFVAYSVLFPTIPLDFDMNNPNSSKNTLVSPRIEQTKTFPAKGIIGANEKFLFNANPIGQFSDADISFTLAKKGNNIEGATIKIQKSYQAFFFPSGNPIGFKDGSLLTTADGAYYLVSNGALRKFSNTNIILALGYPKNAFITVSNDDLKYNKIGEEIKDANAYPDNTIFVIDNNYYELQGGQLSQFVSARAFLSQFNSANAIAKNNDFLSSYQLSETSLGFADGTLASSADSVFILSEGKSFPIENADTFNAMGFDWNNVIPVTSDELSAYKQQKQFTHDQPHPNGTIFVDQKTSAYFMIKDGFKLPIPNETIMKTYSQQKPILVDSQSASVESSCELKKNLFSSNTFGCSANLQSLEKLIGNDYQVSATFPSATNLNSVNVTFSTPLTLNSLKGSLSKIKGRIIKGY